MKVSGFSFIRNAILYDYPIVEAITSVLPLCDEFIVAVGESSDETLALIQAIDKNKIKIIQTQWDDSLREGGKVLAVETDKALKEVAKDADWAFYIQGDEVLHEKYLPTVKSAMKKYKDDHQTEGLLFKYLHFYGAYAYVGDSLRWYPYEIRIIRPKEGIFSYKDAQGFRKKPNQKLKVRLIDAYIYHYGWVKPPKIQQKKYQSFYKLWHSDDWLNKKQSQNNQYDYSDIDALKIFDGTHPQVMQERVKRQDWVFEFDTQHRNIGWRERIKQWVLQNTGYYLGYKNYILL